MKNKIMPITIAGMLALCISQNTAAIETNGITKFKMTNDKLPVPEGFIRITADSEYSEKLGYGWTDGERVSWKKTECGFYWSKDVLKTGTFPDIITGSWVSPGRWHSYFSNFRSPLAGEGEIEFRIDAPPGAYYVYVILGDYYYQKSQTNYLRHSYSVNINGKKEVDVKLTGKEFADMYYIHEFEDYNPQISYWERYVKPRFERTSHLVKTSSDGSIRIRIKDIPVSMIAVWPEAEKAQAEAWLKDLDKLREASCELCLAESEKEKAAKAFFLPSPEQAKTGYVVFANDNWMDAIYPYTRPDQKSMESDCKLFAAIGEIEPVTFGVYPLKDIPELKVEVSDLKDSRQNIIPSANVDVRVAKCIESPVTTGSSTMDASAHAPALGLKYTIKPWILVGKNSMRLYKDVTRECWLRINVPGNAVPGTYEGHITISSNTGKAVKKKLILSVLPFKLKTFMDLDKYVDLTISYVYPPNPTVWPGFDKGKSALIKEWLSYGFNVAPLSYEPLDLIWNARNIEEAKAKMDFKSMEDCVKDWRSAGQVKAFIITGFLTKTTGRFIGKRLPVYRPTADHPGDVKTFPEGFDKVYAELALFVSDEFKKRGWPDIIFDEGGEGGGYEIGRYMELHLHGILHKIGVKNSLALSGVFDYFKEIIPLLWAPHDYYFNVEHYEWMKKNNANIFYLAVFNRFERGLYFWRINAKGHHNEGYCAVFNDPYDLFDSVWADFGIVYPSRSGIGVNPTIDAELIREGHDDARYLFHLQSLVKEAGNSSNEKVVEAVDSARALMEKLEKTFNPDLNYYRKMGYPSNDVYEKIRRRVAQQIENLEKALAEAKASVK